MSFKKFLRKEFGSLRNFKRQFMSESGHFKHDWIRLMNLQKRRYLMRKGRD